MTGLPRFGTSNVRRRIHGVPACANATKHSLRLRRFHTRVNASQRHVSAIAGNAGNRTMTVTVPTGRGTMCLGAYRLLREANVDLARKDGWTVQITLISDDYEPAMRLPQSCKERM